MDRDFLTAVESSLGNMSKRQKLIAEYILEHGGAAAHETASAIAAETGVSESTVVRFAVFMGYEGYPEMQKALRTSLRKRMTSVERIEDVNSRVREEDIIDGVLDGDSDMILFAKRELDREAFKKSVDMLMSAKKVYLIGMRSSSVLAQFMNYYLRLLLDNVTLVCPSGGSEIFEHLVNLSSDDVVFAISYPRYSSGTIRAAEFARRRGAGVIVLTDSETSPIAAGADAVLAAKSEMVSFVDSLVAPMSIINAIIAYIGKRRPDVADKFRLLEDVWNEYNVYTEG